METPFENKTSATVKTISLALYTIFCIAVTVRIYFYIQHKDLWCDESLLFSALYHGSWGDILQCKLLFAQCCPIFFAVVNKFLLCFSCKQHILYFLPTCVGIGLLLIYLLLSEKMGGKLYALICCSLISVIYMPIYYSSEFKQYIFEAFVSTSFIYIYIYI